MHSSSLDSTSLASGSAPEALASLRRFAHATAPVERCELCGAGIAAEHQHLLDRISRQAVSSCDACAILFSGHRG